MKTMIRYTLLPLLVLFLFSLSAAAREAADGPPSPDVRRHPAMPATPQTPTARVIYVDASATGANNGSSWANAYTHLSVALFHASFGAHLWVAEGVYTPGTQRDDSFFLKNGVSVYGGFPTGGGDGTFSARFPRVHLTHLSGEIGGNDNDDNTFHVIHGDSDAQEGIIIDGVVIADGAAVGASDHNSGGGVLIEGSRLTLRDCILLRNYSDGPGPALAAFSGADVTIDGCFIVSNGTGNEGSALDIRDSTALIANTTFTQNGATFGIGPLWLVNSTSTVSNSAFYDNSNLTPSSGVITVQGGTSTINHVSMTDHNQIGLAVIPVGAAPGAATVTNSIFWDNGATELTSGGQSTLAVSDSIIKGGFSGGTNILNQNPQFIDATGGDLTLAIFSPAIDVGNLSTCAAADLRGYPRPIGNGCDMGAYEREKVNSVCSFPNPAPAIPDNDPQGLDDTLTFSHSGVILDVNIWLDVSHAYVGDLAATVRQDSSGVSQVILNRPSRAGAGPGSCDQKDIDVIFDDDSLSMPADKMCLIGPPALADRAAPSQALSVFDGQPVQGGTSWTLTLRDLSGGDTGVLNDWCVELAWMPALQVTRTDDPPPDGCQTGDCSLREAILDANATPGTDDVITFGVSGPFVLSRAGANENAADTGDLDITTNVTLIGNGTGDTIIDGAALDRVFHVLNGADVAFSDLTVRNGFIDPVNDIGEGGGIHVFDGSHLRLIRTILHDNHALASGSGAGLGGALAGTFGSTLMMEDSAIYGSSANLYGAIYNFAGEITLVNTTVYGNSGQYGAVQNSSGIGAPATLDVRSSTIAGNSGGPAIETYAFDGAAAATATLQNSIVSGPGQHCSIAGDNGATAELASLGHNIAGDDSCNLIDPTDFPNTNPRLGPLADNGGATMTAALLKGSPALDNGNDLACPGHDQRGLTRVDRDGNGDPGDTNPCDIGAFELQAAVLNMPPVANDQTVNVIKNTPRAITLTGSDADGDALDYVVTTAPAHGTLSGAPPNVTYTPAANFTGSDFFTFLVNDGLVASPEATVTINVANTPPPNTAPVANGQSVTTTRETPKAFTLTASDADGDPLTYEIILTPMFGTLSGTAPNLTYTPGPGFIGADVFTFRVSDGTDFSQPATVGISVTENAPTVNLYLPMVRR